MKFVLATLALIQTDLEEAIRAIRDGRMELALSKFALIAARLEAASQELRA